MKEQSFSINTNTMNNVSMFLDKIFIELTIHFF